MTEIKTRVKSPRTRRARYVRFTEEENQRLEEEEKQTGKTGPELLKEAYLGKKATAVLMKDDDKNHFCIQLNRIGNNVNQIAKRINSGFAQGYDQDIETVRAQLSALLAWMTAKYHTNRND